MTDSPLTRLARALLLAVVAVVLVGLVAVAASGYSVGGSGSSAPAPYAVDTILTILLGLFAIASVVMFVGLFWVGLDARRHPQRTRAERRLRPGVLVTAAVLFSLALFALLRFQHDRSGERPPAQLPTARSVQPRDLNGKRRDPQFQWIPFIALFGAAGVAAAGYYLSEKRRKSRLPPDLLVTDELAETLDETLADLRAESDPRRAVIAAYHRMERVLATHGIARRTSEAPHEYLGRVLAELTGGGQGAKRLTALFERARFSTHTVDATMRTDAIEAVEDLQAELVRVEAAKAA
jgi:Domain of unknown function (DUF4129)